ncbi:MAG: mechanosensitive ion channel family protein [Acidimicrobiia bacterium]
MLQPILAIDAALSSACGSDPGFVCELVFDATGNETLAEVADVLIRPIKVILILVFAWLINRITHRLLDRGVRKMVASQEEKTRNAGAGPEDSDAPPGRLAALRALTQRRTERATVQAERGRQRAETLGAVLRSAATLVIFAIAGTMALGEFAVNLGPLIAGAGIVGVAFGFGAQSLVKDFLAGIFMMVEDQYGVGDIIDVGEAAGVVEEVKLRTTQIRDVNGTLWHVPNGEIHRVANKSQEWARAVLDIEVAYDTDIAHAMTVIKNVADSVWEDALDHATVLEEPQIWGVESFGADAISIRLVLKVEPAEQFAVAREVRRRLKDGFDAEGIEIPFPQRTVWMHHVTEPDELSPPAPSAAQGTGDPFRPKGAPEGEF